MTFIKEAQKIVTAFIPAIIILALAERMSANIEDFLFNVMILLGLAIAIPEIVERCMEKWRGDGSD